MKKLPNYFVLYCKFLKEYYHVYYQLMLTFFPFVLGAILDRNYKDTIVGVGYAFGKTENDIIFGFLDFIEVVGAKILDFYLYFGLSKDVANLCGLITYSCGITLLFYFIFFFLLELYLLKYRLKGLTTQEIIELKKIQRLKSSIKDKNDY